MKSKLAAVLCALSLLLCQSCAAARTPDPASESPSQSAASAAASGSAEKLRARLTVAGDLVMHTTLVDQSRTEGGYDFTPLFEDVKGYIQNSDLAMCCFEGAFAEKNYQGYPLFLVPDALAESLKDVGFDLVATASNHCLDGGKTGLDRTLDVLDAAGVDHVGTYRTQAERDENRGVLLKNVNGIKIAFLDYTYGTNGMPTGKYRYAVNLLYTDYMSAASDIDYALLDADLAYARSLKPDLIAASVHWGKEYIPEKQASQEKLAEYLFSRGVDLVLGGHPHVPEPLETVTVKNEDGTEKTGFICYCLGNLLANMKETDHKYDTLTAMVQIDVAKDAGTGKTEIEKVRYIPMAVIDTHDLGIKGTDWRFRLWDLNSAISGCESGDDRGGVITPGLYETLKEYRADLEGIMGTELEMRTDK